MKKILIFILLLGFGTAHAEECTSKFNNYEQFVALEFAIAQDLPDKLTYLFEKECVDPLVTYSNSPPPIYMVKNVKQLHIFMQHGGNITQLTNDQGFPYIIPFQLYIKTYLERYKFVPKIKDLSERLGFNFEGEEIWNENLTKNIDHDAVLKEVVNILPDYIWTEKDYRGYTSLGYLTFYRKPEIIKAIVNKNPLSSKIKDSDIYPVAFNIFLSNCFLDKNQEEYQKKDAQITAIFLNNGFDPLNDTIPYMKYQMNFLEAVALFEPNNKYMLDLLYKKGYKKDYQKAVTEAGEFRKKFFDIFKYEPKFDESRTGQGNQYNDFGVVNSCLATTTTPP